MLNPAAMCRAWLCSTALLQPRLLGSTDAHWCQRGGPCGPEPAAASHHLPFSHRQAHSLLWSSAHPFPQGCLLPAPPELSLCWEQQGWQQHSPGWCF